MIEEWERALQKQIRFVSEIRLSANATYRLAFRPVGRISTA